MKQKRQNSGMVQANDLRVGSAKRPISGSRSRELHGKYYGLMLKTIIWPLAWIFISQFFDI